MNETIFVFDMKSQGCKIPMKSLLANDFRSFVSNYCQNKGHLKYDFQINKNMTWYLKIVIRANLYARCQIFFHVILDNKANREVNHIEN